MTTYAFDLDTYSEFSIVWRRIEENTRKYAITSVIIIYIQVSVFKPRTNKPRCRLSRACAMDPRIFCYVH